MTAYRILGEKPTDFEKNLFLKRQVKDLNEEIKQLKSNEVLRAKDFEIGVLKSDIAELEDKIKRMKTEDQRNGKKRLKQTIEHLKNRIKNLENELNIAKQ